MFCCWIGPKFNVVYVCFFSPSCCALLYFSFSVNELQVSVSKKKKKRYLFAEELESNLLPSDEDEVPFARHGLCRT